MAPRYAVYFAPEPGSPLDKFGAKWFGRDSDTSKTSPQPDVPGLAPERVKEITEGPRRYGFHGTLKPPFELSPSVTLDGLLAAARLFAKSAPIIELPPLELAVIGKFAALTPETASAPLELLASACVRCFEGFRVPLNAEQEADYRRNKLTVHQEHMLLHWGYPYVMEEFRFHISLTDRIDDDDERDAVMATLTKLAAPIINKAISVREIAVFGQAMYDAPMKLVERIPFGRKK